MGKGRLGLKRMGRMAFFHKSSPVSYGYVITNDNPQPPIVEMPNVVEKEIVEVPVEVIEKEPSSFVLLMKQIKEKKKKMTISNFLLVLLLILGVATFIFILVLLLIGTGLLQPGLGATAPAMIAAFV